MIFIMKNSKKIIMGIVFVVTGISLKALAPCGFFTHVGGTNYTGVASAEISGSSATLNKAIFKYEIECSENVSKDQLNEVLTLSGVKNVATNQLVTADELMKKNSSLDPIYIDNVGSFFRKEGDTGKLSRFDLKMKAESSLKTILNVVNEIEIDPLYINHIKDELDYLEKQADKEDTSKYWSNIITVTFGGNSYYHATYLSGLVDKAIEVATKCWDINNSETVKKYLGEAIKYKTEYSSQTDEKSKLQKLVVALNRAYAACGKSIVAEADGVDESYFGTTIESYYWCLIFNTNNTTYEQAWQCTLGLYQDLSGINEVREKAKALNIFSAIQEYDLNLDTNEELALTEDNLMTYNTFKIYNIESENKKAKLYFVKDDVNKKNIVTFEIPLKLPEYVMINDSQNSYKKTMKILSFNISTSYVNPILNP